MSCNDRRQLVSFPSKALLCFILMMLSSDGGVVDGLEKRTVEVTSLQQLTVSMRELEAEVTALQRDVNRGKRRAVSFTAYSSQVTITTGNQGIFVFNMVVSNIGNGYDPVTGVFTAPCSGTYLFLLNIMLASPNNIIGVAIDKSGTLLGLAFAKSKIDYWDKGMCHVTVHLNSGDRVYVRHTSGVPQLYGGRWSTFTGALIH